jgi:cyclase
MKTTALFCATVLLGGALARAADAPGLSFTLKPIGPNVWAAIALPKSDAGANAGFVVGDDSVLVVDTFESQDAAKQLLAEIGKVTKLPVKYVVNTHYHLDHVAGNTVFTAGGAVVLGHSNIAAWIHTENLKFFGKEPKAEDKSMVEAFVSPQITYGEGVVVHLGSRVVLVRYYPGHTGGDSVVTIPDAKVTFGGDLFWCETLPNLIDASTKVWITTLNELEAAYPENSFVPGHGEVGKLAEVRAFRGYLTDLRSWVGAAQTQGKSGDGLMEAVLAESKAKYGRFQFFDYFSKKNITDTDAELRGTKKIPIPPRP